MRKPLHMGTAVLTQISAVILLVCAILSAGNAISRYFFSVSSPFIEEFCTYGCVLLMFLMQPRLEYKDEQLSISVLDEKLAKFPAIRTVLFWFRGAVTLFIYFFIIRAGFEVIRMNVNNGASTPVMHFPYSILYGIVVAAMLLLVVYWIFHFFINDHKLRRDKSD